MVDVAYDSVGKDTFPGSLEALAMRAHLVNFGQSSGPVEPFLISRLFEKSNTITRPNLFHYFVGADRTVMVQRLFQALADGVIRAGECQEYGVGDVVQAHTDLEARNTTGAVLLKM